MKHLLGSSTFEKPCAACAPWFTSDAFEWMIGRAMTAIQFQGGLTMVAQREPQHMTLDEWRELERTSHDIKHEYIDGQVYAMSGGSLAHSRIGLNVCTALERALA